MTCSFSSTSTKNYTDNLSFPVAFSFPVSIACVLLGEKINIFMTEHILDTYVPHRYILPPLTRICKTDQIPSKGLYK